MKPLHKLIMVGTTFLLAAATGHVMQNPDSFGMNEPLSPSDGGIVSAAYVQKTVIMRLSSASPAAVDHEYTGGPLETGLPPLPTLQTPAADTGTGPLTGLQDPAPVSFPASCSGAMMDLAPAPKASVRVTISAPCAPGDHLDLRHAGIDLPLTLDQGGNWSGIVPALATEARFAATLPDGTRLEAQTHVLGLDQYNRVALSWSGDADLEMDVTEPTAVRGALGQVAAASPRMMQALPTGWMARFDAAQSEAHAQIYTAPVSLTDTHFDVAAEVTSENCAQDIRAHLRRVIGGKAEAPSKLTLALPECDGIYGEIVMPLPDLPVSVAAN